MKDTVWYSWQLFSVQLYISMAFLSSKFIIFITLLELKRIKLYYFKKVH